MSNNRIASFLNEAGRSELGLSEGSVYGFCKKFAKASKANILKLDFLNQYAGILLHDHETVLYHFGTDHAKCNVHIIRYLCKNTEESGNTWSDDMITLLCEMNRKRKEFMEQGTSALPDEIITEYEEKYFLLLKKGKEENKKTAHKYAKQDEKALLNKLEKLFMGTPAIF